ncbi:MAG: tyrosyl-tRNA synthetase [Sphingobacteriales bacterium]|jgi:tyrosyl-tRNA synthetase
MSYELLYLHFEIKYMKNFVEELKWRGMIHDVMPGTEEKLLEGLKVGYAGFDPTADSLHIGNLVPVMLLTHLQRCGHKPIALVGGATGMVGDPSGKSDERNLLDKETLDYNLSCVQKQLEQFLDFNDSENGAEIVNNYDWFSEFSFLDFIRDAGKHITVSYMLSKDSVKNRMEKGLSFTEFSYQLVQGYDFYHLYKEKKCILQVGGSDQWGNIVTGTELIRRKSGGEGFALTCPLITKADGGKFGKTEEGNVWLDAEKTSPYKFYQFWLNTSDEDASTFIRIFTLKSQEEIEALEKEHNEAPHLRVLQKALAEEVTIRVHSEKDLDTAIKASEILFGKATKESLSAIDEKTLLSVFDGVPTISVKKSLVTNVGLIDLLAEHSDVFSSKGEARKMIQSGGVSINKAKVTAIDHNITNADLLNDKYIIAQKGKKNYYLIIAE